MTDRKVMKLATRGKRLGAFCIDAVIPSVAWTVITISAITEAVSRQAAQLFGIPGFGVPGFGFPGYGYGFGYDYGYRSGHSTLTTVMILILLAYSIAQLFFFTRSSTMGKAALGLQVVSTEDGSPIGFWKMLLREWIVKFASASVFMLGYIWILIDDRNRGWHDKILDTYVMDLKETARLENRNAHRYRPVQPEMYTQPAVPEKAVQDPVYYQMAEGTPDESGSQSPFSGYEEL